MDNQSLLFQIDSSALYALQAVLQATPKEVEGAFNRAVKRTERTMRPRSIKAMRLGMGAKSSKVIRRRVQAYRYMFRVGQTDGSFDALKLWYGLSDISVGHLKGRVSRVGTKRDPQGAKFTSQAVGEHDFESGFVTRLYSRRSIFLRKGASRFPVREARVDMAHLHAYLEDEIYSELPEVFMNHYETDLKGRVAARDVIRQRQRSWNKYAE